MIGLFCSWLAEVWGSDGFHHILVGDGSVFFRWSFSPKGGPGSWMLAWHPFWADSRAICLLAWGFALLNMTWSSSCLRMMYPVRPCRKLGVIARGSGLICPITLSGGSVVLPNAYGTLSRSSLTVSPLTVRPLTVWPWIIRSRFSAASFPWSWLIGWAVRSLMDICRLCSYHKLSVLGCWLRAGGGWRPGFWTLHRGSVGRSLLGPSFTESARLLKVRRWYSSGGPAHCLSVGICGVVVLRMMFSRS